MSYYPKNNYPEYQEYYDSGYPENQGYQGYYDYNYPKRKKERKINISTNSVLYFVTFIIILILCLMLYFLTSKFSTTDINYPIDCEGIWDEKGECNELTRKMTQTYIVTNEALNGGACPNEGKEKEIFNSKCSEVKCSGIWNMLECNPETGIASQKFKVLRKEKNGGKPCDAKDGDFKLDKHPMCTKNFVNNDPDVTITYESDGTFKFKEVEINENGLDEWGNPIKRDCSGVWDEWGPCKSTYVYCINKIRNNSDPSKSDYSNCTVQNKSKRDFKVVKKAIGKGEECPISEDKDCGVPYLILGNNPWAQCSSGYIGTIDKNFIDNHYLSGGTTKSFDECSIKCSNTNFKNSKGMPFECKAFDYENDSGACSLYDTSLNILRPKIPDGFDYQNKKNKSYNDYTGCFYNKKYKSPEMVKGDYLKYGDFLKSYNGNVNLTMSQNGYLYLSLWKDNKRKYWSAAHPDYYEDDKISKIQHENTKNGLITNIIGFDDFPENKRGYIFIYQQDGNLVLYNKDFNKIWESNTTGKKSDSLKLEDKKGLILYNDKEVVWQADPLKDVPSFKEENKKTYTGWSDLDNKVLAPADQFVSLLGSVLGF